MISASSDWKDIMSRPIRNRAYISVGIGIVNQNAQASGKAGGDFAYWSYGDIFDANQNRIEYATLESNYAKTDGTQYFMPENDELMQLQQNGIVTQEMLGTVRIDFQEIHSIKGITIEFASNYPTRLKIQTEEKELIYSNESEKFTTTDVLGDTNYIVITPIAMSGGSQRLRIKSILMGVGLQYGNRQTKSFSIDEYVSSISEELPSEKTNYSFYDGENYFNVDDDNSFIDFLETMQKVTVSFGVELDDGNVEWHQIATQYLKDWKSQKGAVSITATDRLSQMEDEYTFANRIYQRTAYQEAESIFSDAGLEPDEYLIDEYLNDVQLNNPMPEGTHRECLQILANACRCILRQDEHGKVVIQANFANVLDPEDFTVETNGVSDWSKPENLLIGTDIVYADMTLNFSSTDGMQYFMPEDSNYLETSYVSGLISNEDGLFEENPTISLTMPAAYSYFGVNVKFDGNPPLEMYVHTYKNDEHQESVRFENLLNDSVLFHEFLSFDKMIFEFTKGYPHNRVLVNKISFGDLTDYVLKRINMLENPIGCKEKRAKAVRCKIFTYQVNESGEVEEVEDNIFATRAIGDVGEVKTVQNPLVSTQEHAELLAEWVGNYYANNVSYDVKFRGEPRLNAADVIRMESDKKNNLQVEVTRSKLSFNGAFSGSLELRRALKMMGA